MPTLERAIAIAATAHAGQVDKAGEIYIFHPLTLMMEMDTLEEKIVAVLHDVIEDNFEWTIERLRDEGFSEDVLEALDCLTRRDGEDYFVMIERVVANPLAKKVKCRDLKHNMNVLRLKTFGEREAERLIKYHKAYQILAA